MEFIGKKEEDRNKGIHNWSKIRTVTHYFGRLLFQIFPILHHPPTNTVAYSLHLYHILCPIKTRLEVFLLKFQITAQYAFLYQNVFNHNAITMYGKDIKCAFIFAMEWINSCSLPPICITNRSVSPTNYTSIQDKLYRLTKEKKDDIPAQNQIKQKSWSLEFHTFEKFYAGGHQFILCN